MVFLLAIHLDFSLPFGETIYTVNESNGSVEICIKLVSTGKEGLFVDPVGASATLQNDSAVGKTLNNHTVQLTHAHDILLYSCVYTR